MTPDLMGGGREGESSARKINAMEKKLIQCDNSFSDKLHQQVITAVQWGYPTQDHPVTSRSRRSWLALICCGQYMAIGMPVHGDLTSLMFRMASSLTLWVPTV